tara:strand:+ start:231 stop:569 length:339 start_codon:yes stop_codon:yes gene_type:complete
MEQLRPWGTYEILSSEIGYQIKKLVVAKNQKISLQYHQHRSEHWVVISGSGQAINGETQTSITPGCHIFVEKNTIHRLANTGSEDLIIIEIQLGKYLEEDDIVRLEDEYGRV